MNAKSLERSEKSHLSGGQMEGWNFIIPSIDSAVFLFSPFQVRQLAYSNAELK
jgi:hypothetical protein